MPFISSTTSSYAGGQRASTDSFAGLGKSNRIIVHYDPSDSTSYSGSGTTLTDLTSNSYNGTLVSSPTFDNDHFNYEGGDYFVTPNISSSISSDVHTVEIWVYPTDNDGCLAVYLNDTNPDTGYRFSAIEMVSGQLEFGLWGGASIVSSGPTGSVTLNTWHQVVLSYDGSHIRGFVDGERVCKVAVTFSNPMGEGGGWHIAVGPGCVTNQGSGGDLRDWSVGIFRVYNAKLNRSAIRRNYLKDKNTHTAPTSAWDPSTDITPAYWLDASDTSSYTLSSSTLNTVTDKAGNFTVTVDGSPTRISNGLNSLNVWDFDGNESLITGSGPYASSGNHWAVGVFRWDQVDATKDSFFSADGTRTYAVSSSQSSNSWSGEIDYDGSNTITGSARNTFTTSISRNSWTIVSIVANKSVNQFFGRINGTTRTSIDSYVQSMDTTVSDVRMMRNRTAKKLDGQLAEYFHVAGIPGTGGTDISDVEKAEGYLAHKWGLTSSLPSSHPYKNLTP